MKTNGHYDSMRDMTGVLLVIFGIQRSGTSWVWQVLGRLLKQGVVRTHSYLTVPEDIPLVCCYRDPRDMVVSEWRVSGRQMGRVMMDEEDIYAIVGNRQREFWIFDQYERKQRDRIALRYEQLIANPLTEVRAILNRVDAAVSDAELQAALFEHSVERNRCLSAKGPVPERLMLKGHVHEAQIGTWRRFVSDENKTLLERLLLPRLKNWGYW